MLHLGAHGSQKCNSFLPCLLPPFIQFYFISQQKVRVAQLTRLILTDERETHEKKYPFVTSQEKWHLKSALKHNYIFIFLNLLLLFFLEHFSQTQAIILPMLDHICFSCAAVWRKIDFDWGFMTPVVNLDVRYVLIKNPNFVSVCLFSKDDWIPLSFLSSQDSISALAHDLNYPALRKNKNIEAFLNRCKSQPCVWWRSRFSCLTWKMGIKLLNTNHSAPVMRNWVCWFLVNAH